MEIIAPGDKLVALYLDDKNSVAFITERQTQEMLLKWGSGTRRSVQSSKNLRKGIGGDIITVNAFTIVGNPQKIPYIQTLKSSPAAT